MSVTTPTAEAPTHAARLSAALGDLDTSYDADVQALVSPDTATADPPPTTPGANATAAAPEEHGAATPDPERPDPAAAADASDAPPATDAVKGKTFTTDEVEARIAEATKRARTDQSKTAERLVALEAELAKAREEAESFRFDAQVMWQSQQEAKRLAREQGGVRYEDFDTTTERALAEQTDLRNRELAQRQQAAGQQAAQEQFAAQEIERRTEVGTQVFKDAVASVLEAAMEAGIKLTKKDAEHRVVTTYGDELVEADKAMWRDLRTPPDVARTRIAVAGKRMTELAIAALTQEAITQVEAERKPVETYDRTQMHGEATGRVSGTRVLSYKERKAHALAEADAQAAADAEKFASPTTTYSY